MKRIASFILLFALILSLGATARAEEPDWVRAFAAVLNEKQAKAAAKEKEMGYMFDQCH